MTDTHKLGVPEKNLRCRMLFFNNLNGYLINCKLLTSFRISCYNNLFQMYHFQDSD